MRPPKIISTDTYKGYPLNYNNDEFYKPILDATLVQLEAMLSHYSRVFTFRFDLRFNSVFDHTKVSDISLVNTFFKKVVDYLKARRAADSAYRNHQRIGYQWIKEVEKAKHGHFHCWLAVSGHKVHQTGWNAISNKPETGLVAIIAKTWEEVSGGSIHISDSHMLRSDRGTGLIDPRPMEDCIKHYSYLSKTRGKGYGGVRPNERNHGHSRVKPLDV